MKKFLKDWSLFEILFLIFSLTTITLCFLLEKDKNIFSLITSLTGVVSVLTVAKGLIIAPVINIIYNIIYAALSITQQYYGEAIIYIFLMIPISIISIMSWLKNKSKTNENIVEINKISFREYVYLFIFIIIATIGFYFLLKTLHTSELIISTISLISSLVASYLMLRRCSYYAIGFMINDIILIILWSLVVKNNSIAYLPTVITFIVFLINDTYGFIHWKSMENKQKNK